MQPSYRGARAALLTRHRKGAVVAPVLRSALAIELHETDAFDTDALGTFTGEIERALAPRDCAIRKAMIACTLTGLEYGLGSEGTFGPGPFGTMLTWNTELLAWHDHAHNLTVIGRAEGPSSARRGEVDSMDAACTLVAGFPYGQGVIVRSTRGIRKGLVGPQAVRAALAQWFGAALAEPVTIEYDLRAHHCPERRHRIAAAARDLVRRLQSTCPHCGRPDFSPDRAEPGLPCRECAAPTSRILRRSARCAGCGYQQDYPADEATADPFDCGFCNP